MPVPATIAETILRELNAFSVKNRKPDQFTQRRLINEIDKLKAANLDAALLCEAILATLNSDFSTVKRKFDEILARDPNNVSMLENCANSMHRLGRFNLSLEHYSKAMEIQRNSSSLLIDIANNSHATLRPDKFERALEIYLKATNNEDILNESRVRSSISMAKNFKSHEIDPLEANKLYLAAEAVILKFNSTLDIGGYELCGEYGGADISMYAGVDADEEQLHAMNMALCDEILDREIQHILSKVTIAFVPREGIPSTDTESSATIQL